MPLGPWKTFAACVAYQRRQGYTDTVARKICGQIEADTKKAKK